METSKFVFHMNQYVILTIIRGTLTDSLYIYMFMLYINYTFIQLIFILNLIPEHS